MTIKPQIDVWKVVDSLKEDFEEEGFTEAMAQVVGKTTVHGKKAQIHIVLTTDEDDFL